MPILRSLTLGLSLAAALAAVAPAAANPRFTAQPQVRILNKIDNADITLRPRTTTARIAGATDQGRVDPTTQYNHMMLVLKNTSEQEFTLTGLLDQQQDKSSPNYHQWMTPETFGASFGVASSDLAKITAWLQDSGFIVEQVTKGARIIQFAGTAGQIEAAFHTEMHRYLSNGESHVANSIDISIPSALASVVAGVASLNDFSPKNHMLNARSVVRGTDGEMYPVTPGTTSPDYTFATSGAHYVGAGDIATIFNTKPLLAAGIDGTGVKIGIIGQTDILLSDIQIYRSIFNLPKNDPTFTRVGGDPGTIPDDGESDLDVELSGGAAPGASINFVTSGNSYFGGGIDASGLYLVENNDADIISLSYGGCEVNLGATENAFYNALWEQAASQGQTVFVSSGDSGPATCDGSTASYETQGYNVNGLASTPFNVAVGGTQFNEGTTSGATQYWGPATGAPYSTALGYIPEAPLDESRFGDNSWPSQVIFGGGSGISFYYQIPSFQTGPGVPSADPTPNAGTISSTSFVVPGPHRYLPDVSLISSVYHDSTVYCSEGSCKLNADGTVAGLGLVGGTSVAAPTMAGVQALINQKNGGRQGNANYYYYRIAAAQSQTNCVSATYVTSAGCGFHDGQVGTTNIPSNSAATAYIGWSAGPGYDLALGLGSPDVYNLATAWSTVSFHATTTSLTLTPTTGISHGTPQTFNIAVNPVSGSGASPTGDVSIIAGVANGGVGFYTLSNGTASGSLTGLPAGTYNVYAHYAGDITYGGSNSAPLSVTITPEGSVLTAHSYLLSATGSMTAATSFLYGANVYIDAQVAGASGTGTPTGTVGFNLSRGTTAASSLNNLLDSFGDTYFDAGLGYAGYDIMPTAPVLSPGTYTAAISYSGDTSFNASTATPITFTISPANQALALRAVSTEITSGTIATFNASIATISPAAGGVPATGTVTFTDTTTSTVLGTGTLVNGAVVFNTNAITSIGAHSITATYSGDANYLTRTSASAAIAVGGATSTISLAASTLSAPVGTSITLTATLPTGSTGTVFFYDNGASLGGATISTATLTAAITVTALLAGTHSITATSSGNATLATATSAAMVLTLTKNTPTLQLTAQQSNATAATVAMNATLNPFPRGAAGNNPPPTGLVQFLDGTTSLGNATAVYLPGGYNNYVAGFTTQALNPGSHKLTATYLGDANFATVTSNMQTVNIGLTTPTLTASVTTVGSGATFTLTDRIVPQLASTAAIGGTVTFYDGTISLGTAPVVSGTATLSAAVLVGLGSHSITAVYSGDTNFYTSTTAATSITVVQAAVTPTLAVSATTVQLGTAVTLTATTPPSSTGTITFLDNGVSLGTVPLTGTAPTASLTVASFAVRSHSLTVTYFGDTNFLAGTSAAVSLSVTQANATPILTVSASTVPLGTSVTLTATTPITPAISTGTITFLDNGVPIGTVPLAGIVPTASLTVASLAVRSHSLTAAYSGDTNFLPAVSLTNVLTITQAGAVPVLTLSAATIQVGTSVTLTAVTPVTPAISTGTITFLDNGVSLGTTALAGTTPTASLIVTNFAARSHSLTVAYSGDTNFLAGASAVTVLTVTQNTPTLQLASLQSTSAATPVTLNATLTPALAGAGQNSPAPSGVIQFTDGTTILGSSPPVALSDGSGNYAALLTITLKPGPHTIAAVFTGDTNYTAASTTAQTVNLGLTTTAITSSASTVGLGTHFLLTAKITPVIAGTTAIGGTVTFSEGTTILGTSPVTAGTATLTTALTSTASSNHSIGVIYNGDANFFPSTNVITIVTVTPGFAVSISPGSLTITRGSSGSALISVTSTGNYSGTITPTCTGLPSLSTCTFSPVSLLFNGVNGTQTTTVTIATTAPVTSSSFLWLPSLILAGFVAFRRRQLTVRCRHLLILAVMASGLMAVCGCGSSTPGTTTTTGGTPVGNTTVTLNLSAVGATASSPTGQSTAILTVTIQ